MKVACDNVKAKTIFCLTNKSRNVKFYTEDPKTGKIISPDVGTLVANDIVREGSDNLMYEFYILTA